MRRWLALALPGGLRSYFASWRTDPIASLACDVGRAVGAPVDFSADPMTVVGGARLSIRLLSGGPCSPCLRRPLAGRSASETGLRAGQRGTSVCGGRARARSRRRCRNQARIRGRSLDQRWVKLKGDSLKSRYPSRKATLLPFGSTPATDAGNYSRQTRQSLR